MWRALFGRTADSLEKGTGADDEYMISDKAILVNRFISGERSVLPAGARQGER